MVEAEEASKLVEEAEEPSRVEGAGLVGSGHAQSVHLRSVLMMTDGFVQMK